uniref:Uncharacterized protein n=1 Tax=Avena sativa TaxID=4498 RepID=A0ACD5WM25_AVESA
MARGLEDLKNHLPVQILVLCSLGLQVILFVCAGARRRETFSGVPVRMTLLWLAYNFGPIFVTVTLGRLSLSSDTGMHPLVTLWAPFLLLHLAGPDNIAAYALQDNQLYLRSLQTFIAQVTAGGYFLYKYRNTSGNFIRLASRLMFVVGVIKYGERWLALQRGNLSSIRDSLKKQQPVIYSHVHKEDVKFMKIDGREKLDDESSVRRAHSMFHICKCWIVDSSEDEPARSNLIGKLRGLEFWTIVEIELSLMYDILYTKAAVIHTWQGYTIRVISPLAILTSLLLFHYSEEDVHGEADRATTYVLFGSALVMEWTSLLNALGSSWMYAYLSTTRIPWLRYTFLCSGRWDRLRRLVLSLNSFVTFGGSRSGVRRWSGNMGQYNMLHFCTRPDTVLTRPLLGTFAKLLGFEELWNRKHFSGAITIWDHKLIKVCIDDHTDLLYEKAWLNTLGMIKYQWGMTTLEYRKPEYDFIEATTLGDEFQEGIIIWHIATDFFLSKCKSGNASRGVVSTVKALSNYMMFLLVERPYMLPGTAQNKLYERTCKALDGAVSQYHPTGICGVLKSLFGWHDDPAASSSSSRATNSRIHAEKMYNKHVSLPDYSYHNVRLNHSATVAKELLEYEEKHSTDMSLQLLLEMWTDMLVYAGNKCSKESHAKKLSSGGELTTIVWLIVEHYHQASLELRGILEGERDHHNYYTV